MRFSRFFLWIREKRIHLHADLKKLVPKWPVRLGVRTADFHSVNRGSIPLRATKQSEYESESNLLAFLFAILSEYNSPDITIL